jgi:hypothetical protein
MDDETTFCPVGMLRPAGELRFDSDASPEPFVIETGASTVSTWAHRFEDGDVGNVVVFVDDLTEYTHDERRMMGRISILTDVLWISTAGGSEIGVKGLPAPCYVDVEELTVGARVVGWVLTPTVAA